MACNLSNIRVKCALPIIVIIPTMLDELPTIENIIRELGPKASILDGGAGKGSFPYDQFPACRIVALDVRSIEGTDDPPNVERVTGNLEELPFGDAEFDLVALNFVLEHTLHPEEVLSEIARVLKPEGVFYFSVPDSASCEDRLFRFAYRLTHPACFIRPSPGNHNQRFTIEAIRELLHRHGFKIAMRVGYPGGFTWMPAWLRFKFLGFCHALGLDPTRNGNYIFRAERAAAEEREITLRYVCFNCGIPRVEVTVEKGRWRCEHCDSSNIHFRPGD